MDENRGAAPRAGPSLGPRPSILEAMKKDKQKRLDSAQSLEYLKKEVEIDDHLLPLEDFLHRYNTSIETGLSAHTVEQNRLEYGRNCLTPPMETPEWVKFFKNWFDMTSCLLWAAALMALIVFLIENQTSLHPTWDNLALSLFLALIVVIISTFKYYQMSKSSQLIHLFANLIPKQTICIRDGVRRSIDSEELTPGDLIEIRPGDQIPADIRIVSATGFKVDNSSLTGESIAEVRTTECTDDNPLETKNLAFYSTNAVEGTATGVVIRIGDTTVVGRIATLAGNLKAVDTPLTRELDAFIRIIAVLACTVAGSLAIVSFALGHSPLDVTIFFVGVLVSLVPEGLMVTVAVMLTHAATRLKDRHGIVKNLEGVETLGSTSVICTDKTGTLTQNRMTVLHVWLGGSIQDAGLEEATDSKPSFATQLDWLNLERTATPAL